MFRCQSCETIVPAGTRSRKIVLQTRSKTYEPRGADPRERGRWGRGRGRGCGGSKKKQQYDKGGVGTEIVREIMVCPTCGEKHAAEEAAATEQAALQLAAAAPVEVEAVVIEEDASSE